MNNIMVINLGLKSIRCIIFDSNGMKLGSASAAIQTAIDDVRVEQSPAQWKEKAFDVMQNALSEARASKISFLTVTTSASCLVCMDANGNPVRDAIMVSDKRAVKEASFINELSSFKPVKEKTGLAVSASLLLPKILWVKKNQPDIFEKTAYFLTPNDYLIHFLSGQVVTDYLNALKYHYILQESSYPLDLLQQIGIPRNKLPDVEDTGICVGPIRSDLADSLGINHNVSVVLSSYDAICSFIGSGVSEDGEASDVSGTVTVFRAVTRKKDLMPSHRVYNLPFHQDDIGIIGGSNNLGGGLIEWVKQCYYQREEFPYEVMEKDARESEVCAKGLLFLPYLLGERAPIWNDEARGVFFGLERMHTRRDMTRAVFESTGFIDCDMIEAIREAGASVDTVRLSGGLARVQLISQIKADILGKEVLVLSEFETTSSGAAMIVLHGQGIYASLKEIADRFAAIRMIIRPDIENHKRYIYMYNLYKEAYQSLKPLYTKRMQILQNIKDNRARDVRVENL